MNAGKGVAGITLMQAAILLSVEGWIEVFAGKRLSFDSSPWAFRGIALALYLANYYLLITRGHGIKFEREFNRFRKSRRTLLVGSCLALMLIAILIVIRSVSAYHYTFHIVPKD